MKVDPILRGSALFVLQDFAGAERSALFAIEISTKSIDTSLAWELAANVALENDDLALALTRFKKAEEFSDPTQSLNLWMDIQEGLLKIARLKQEPNRCVELLRGMYLTVADKRGPLEAKTMSIQNRYANELYLQRRFAEAEKEFIALLKSVDDRSSKNVMQVQVLRDSLSKSIAAQGRKEEAEKIDLRLTSITPNIDKETEASLGQHAQMALAFYQQNKYAEAAGEFRTAYLGYLKRKGAEHDDTLTAKNDLAASLHAAGESEEAAQLLSEVISIREKQLPADDLVLMENLNNLGNALSAIGAHEKAVAQHRRVAEVRKRVLGPRNTKTLGALVNLATDLQMLKRYDEAIAVASEVVKNRILVFGQNNTSTISSRVSLTYILSAAGKDEEAMQEARSIQQLCEKELSPRSPWLFTSHYTMASVLFNAGRIEESEKWCLSALKGFKSVVGAHNSDTIKCEELLSKLSLAPRSGTGRGIASATIAAIPSRSVLAKKLNAHGPDHLETLKARTILAHQLVLAEQYADAEKEYELALSSFKKQALLQTEAGIDARMGQVELMRHTGRLKEAESLVRPLMDDCVANLPENHSFQGAVFANFGLLLNALGRHEEALLAQKEALVRSSHQAENHPRTIKGYYQISTTLWRLNRMDESKAYLQKAYELSRDTVGEKDPQTQKFKHFMEDTSAYGQMIQDLTNKRSSQSSVTAPGLPSATQHLAPVSPPPSSSEPTLSIPSGTPLSPRIFGPGDSLEELKKGWENL